MCWDIDFFLYPGSLNANILYIYIYIYIRPLIPKEGARSGPWKIPRRRRAAAGRIGAAGAAGTRTSGHATIGGGRRRKTVMMRARTPRNGHPATRAQSAKCPPWASCEAQKQQSPLVGNHCSCK